MEKSTKKFDKLGKEIFVGDKVIYPWGGFYWEGKLTTIYRFSTIIEKPAYMMADGNMRDDGDGIIFCLGNCSNSWNGISATVIKGEESLEELKEFEDKLFFYNNDGYPVRYTDQHLMQMSDEEWHKELERRNDNWKKIWR